jgi:4-aminobutyrate aminotransferase-like enzyme
MGSVLTMAPALTIREGDLHRAFDILEASFAEVLAG